MTTGTSELDRWREQIRRGGLELAILVALSGAPRYGLEVIRHLEDASDLVLLEGTVYPILARLTRDGLLKAEWNAEEMTVELERNIGRDLQFIRINGTLVGGLAGLLIHAATEAARAL